LHTLANGSGILAFLKGLNPIDLYRILVKAGGAELLVNDIEILKQFRGPKLVFQYLQQELYPPYDEIPLEEQSSIAFHLSRSCWGDTPYLIRYSLGKEITNANVLSWKNDRGQTLLHCLTQNHIVYISGMDKLNDKSSEYKSRLKNEGDKSFVWRELIREYISAGASLHAVDTGGRTPLFNMIEKFVYCYDLFYLKMKWWHRKWTAIIQEWLADLETCGVDLFLYGKREKALFDGYRYNLYVFETRFYFRLSHLKT